MFWFCAALSAAGVLESVICSCLVAEFAGYWLHRLLHSEQVPMLSRSHMAHRLILYGPPRHHPFNRKGLAVPLQRYTLATPLHPLMDRTGEGKVAFQ
jgi:hypothetical protein